VCRLQLMSPSFGSKSSAKITVAAARLVAYGIRIATRKKVRPRIR
jgi:hypothetical protein